MPGPVKLLEIRGLRTWFELEEGTARAVDGVDLDVREGEVLGLVGESGCGKSVTALSILNLIPAPPGRIVSGEILFRGRDLLKLSRPELRAVRGGDIAMVFQEPMTSLNPVFTVGWQIEEAIRFHQGVGDRRELAARGVRLMGKLGIPDPERRRGAYPHELSGGVRQRVMIAMALACSPALLIADEPTTALDATLQAEILELMLRAKAESGDAAILLITHDLAVVAETCGRVAVMYAGRIQELADADPLFREPLHPYTRGLLDSLPRPGTGKGTRLRAIPGTVPRSLSWPSGCRFQTRCPLAQDRCRRVEPELAEVRPGRRVRCHLVGPEGRA